MTPHAPTEKPFTTVQVLDYLKRYKWVVVIPRNKAALKALVKQGIVVNREDKYMLKGKAE